MAGIQRRITPYYTPPVMQAAIANLLHAGSPQADQPPWIRMPLRPHQRTLLAAARALELCAHITPETSAQMTTHVGVLADRVGAGKSLVALSLVKDPPVRHSTREYSTSGGISYHIGDIQMMPDVEEFNETLFTHAHSDVWEDGWARPNRSRKVQGKFHARTALMIVPHTVIGQWAGYIQEQTVGLKAMIIRKAVECTARPGYLQQIFDSDLVVVSSTMLNRFMSSFNGDGGSCKFRNIVWSRLFIDEADSISMSLCYSFVLFRFIWLISGSWLNMLFCAGYNGHLGADNVERVTGVRNRNAVASQVLGDSRAACFAPRVLRNTDDWLNSSLSTPAIFHNTVRCQPPRSVRALNGIVPSEALEALHAGDTVAAMAAMGIEGTGMDGLIAKVTDKLRCDLAEAARSLEFKRGHTYSSEHARKDGLRAAEAHVTRFQDQLNALMDRLKSLEGGETETVCPICFDSPQTPTLTPCCKQLFCLACICTCLTTKMACPMCRAKIAGVKNLIVVTQSEVKTQESTEDKIPMKGEALIQLIRESTPGFGRCWLLTGFAVRCCMAP